METTEKEIRCPRCNSTNIRKSGRGWKDKIRYVCKDCWRTFQLEDNDVKEVK